MDELTLRRNVLDVSWVDDRWCCLAGRRTSLMSELVICSAKGCRAAASYAVVWNNPKIHPPEREKTWVACEEHRQSLADFLDVRGFLRRVERL